MATIHFHKTTTATPEQLIAGLTELGGQLVGKSATATYTLTPRSDGTTDLDVAIVRERKNLKGRAHAAVIGTVGRRVLVKELDRTIDAIEAQDAALVC